MSDNKELVRRLYDEVFAGGNLGVIDELLAPDAIDHEEVPGASGDARADLKMWLSAFRTAFPDLRVEIHDLIAEADRVAARVTFSGTHQGPFMDMPGTGAKMTLQVIDIMRIENGQMVEHWGASDSGALLEQLQGANA